MECTPQLTAFVFKNIENFYGIELTDREKQMMHVYYGMLSIALENEEHINVDWEHVESLKNEWDELMNSEYTFDDVANWAERNVDVLIDILEQEHEVAEMYRGLK